MESARIRMTAGATSSHLKLRSLQSDSALTRGAEPVAGIFLIVAVLDIPALALFRHSRPRAEPEDQPANLTLERGPMQRRTGPPRIVSRASPPCRAFRRCWPPSLRGA